VFHISRRRATERSRRPPHRCLMPSSTCRGHVGPGMGSGSPGLINKYGVAKSYEVSQLVRTEEIFQRSWWNQMTAIHSCRRCALVSACWKAGSRPTWRHVAQLRRSTSAKLYLLSIIVKFSIFVPSSATVHQLCPVQRSEKVAVKAPSYALWGALVIAHLRASCMMRGLGIELHSKRHYFVKRVAILY
jgi:hypothetical protein